MEAWFSFCVGILRTHIHAGIPGQKYSKEF